MVITKKINPALNGRKAALLAFAPAFFTASTSAYVPMEAGLVMPVFAVLITMVIGGLLILRQQAETHGQERVETLQLRSSRDRPELQGNVRPVFCGNSPKLRIRLTAPPRLPRLYAASLP